MPAAFAALVARIFLDLALDGDGIHNGAWIAAILGALPAMPYLLCLDVLPNDRSAGGPLWLLLLAVTALDVAHVLAVVVRISGYLALDYVADLLLLLPVATAMLWGVGRNGDAIGYAATLWCRLFLVLMAVVILMQLRHYHARWLFPLLGNGWRDITSSSVRVSGWFVTGTAVMLVSDNGRGDRMNRHFILRLAFAPVTAALLLLPRLMMVPTGRQGLSWLGRLDALLTNGRAPLYLQLPLILACFAGLFHLLVCECFAASALLQRLIPKLDGRVCAFIVVLVCGFLALSGVISPILNAIAPWLFVMGSVGVTLTLMLHRAFKGGEASCES